MIQLHLQVQILKCASCRFTASRCFEMFQHWREVGIFALDAPYTGFLSQQQQQKLNKCVLFTPSVNISFRSSETRPAARVFASCTRRRIESSRRMRITVWQRLLIRRRGIIRCTIHERTFYFTDGLSNKCLVI